MIGSLLDILNLNEWQEISNEIEIAKGKNELPLSIREGLKQKKRNRRWSQKY